MRFLSLFDDSQEAEACRRLPADAPVLAAGMLVVGLLGLFVLFLALTNDALAPAAASTWGVLAGVTGIGLWRHGLRQTAKNRFVIAAIVLVLSVSWTASQREPVAPLPQSAEATP